MKPDSFKMTQKRGSADPACFFPAVRAVTSFLCRILSFLRHSVGKNTLIHDMHKCMPADSSGSGGITVRDRAWEGSRWKQTSCQILPSPRQCMIKITSWIMPAWSGEGIGVEQRRAGCSCGRPAGIVGMSTNPASLFSCCVGSRVYPKYYAGHSLATRACHPCPVHCLWRSVGRQSPSALTGLLTVGMDWRGGRKPCPNSTSEAQVVFLYHWRSLLHQQAAESTSFYPGSVKTTEDWIAFLEGMSF